MVFKFNHLIKYSPPSEMKKLTKKNIYNLKKKKNLKSEKLYYSNEADGNCRRASVLSSIDPANFYHKLYYRFI